MCKILKNKGIFLFGNEGTILSKISNINHELLSQQVGVQQTRQRSFSGYGTDMVN
jgi:hypothetical protein